MKITESVNLSHLEFETYTDAINFASAKSSEAPCAIEPDYGQEKLTPNYAAAHKLATSGWHEGRAKMEKMAAAIVTPSRVTRPECVFDVTGEGGCDVGRAMSGHPECVFDWRDSEHTIASQNGPIVRIGFNPSAAGTVDADSIVYRGAAVMALIDALEAAGRRVELVVERVNSRHSGDAANFRITIPVKSTDFQAQPDQIAFALIHPSMNRRVMFSLAMQCGRIGRSAASSGGYGGGTKYRPEGYDVWIPRLEKDFATGKVPHFESQADATAWVFARLAEFGVNTTPEGSH